jgi:hypothetical protein
VSVEPCPQSIPGSSTPGGSPAWGGPIAKLLNADLTLTTDQPFTFTITPALWLIRRVLVRRVSGAFGVACLGGIYTGAGKTGTTCVLAAQSYAGLTGAGTVVDLAIIAAATTNILSVATLFFALTTGNTGALVADIHVFGDVLS